MIQEQRVILKSVGYGEEGSYNDNVAKYNNNHHNHYHYYHYEPRTTHRGPPGGQ